MDLQDKLKAYVTDELLSGRLDVDVDDDLLGNGMVDSIGMMWLIAYIEEDLGVTVPPEDVTIEHFRSIRTIDAYLTAKSS